MQTPSEQREAIQMTQWLTKMGDDKSPSGSAGYVRPEYKSVKELRPHCPKCGDRLRGNNSIAMPYRCRCGTWKQNISDLTFNIEST